MFKMMPYCQVCQRQDHTIELTAGLVHKDLCSELLKLTGSVSAARAALEIFQARCSHPDGSRFYNDSGWDRWWWCPVCFEVVFLNKPAWAS
jgi:hypothetical protein